MWGPRRHLYVNLSQWNQPAFRSSGRWLDGAEQPGGEAREYHSDGRACSGHYTPRGNLEMLSLANGGDDSLWTMSRVRCASLLLPWRIRAPRVACMSDWWNFGQPTRDLLAVTSPAGRIKAVSPRIKDRSQISHTSLYHHPYRSNMFSVPPRV